MARRRALQRLYALLALGTAASCSSPAPPSTRLDVHVIAEASLGLEEVDLSLSAPTTRLPSLNARLPLSRGGAVVTPLVWEVLIPNASSDFMATIQPVGTATGSPSVVASSDVIVASGRHTDITLELSLVCRGVTCATGETCNEGTCQPRPIVGGGSGDGSADSDTGVDGSHDAEPSVDTATVVDAAPARSETSADASSSSDATSDVTSEVSPDSPPDRNGGHAACDGGTCNYDEEG